MPSDRPEKETPPEFVIVMDCAAAVAPSSTVPKSSASGETLSDAAVTPVPASDTTAGPALLPTLIVPARLPAAVGVNPTATMQLAPPASVVPQVVLAMAKSPVTARPRPVSVVPPVFVTVMVCVLELLPITIALKLRLCGVALKSATVSPTPESGTTIAVGAMLNPPERIPAAVGVKLTATLQLAPPASVVPQLLLVSTKSPLIANANPDSAAPPLLVRVMSCALAVAPTCCAEKLKLCGEALRDAAANPIPLSAAVAEATVVPLNVILPLRVPASVGENAIAIVQLPPATSVVPQVEDCSAKSPLTAIARFASTEPPEFVTVTACAALVCPVGVAAKLNCVGLR